jgi:hypothetical protein
VAPIRLDILDVVQEIDRGGDQAEGDEGDQAQPKRVRIEGVVVEQDGDEDEAFLSQWCGRIALIIAVTDMVDPSP